MLLMDLRLLLENSFGCLLCGLRRSHFRSPCHLGARGAVRRVVGHGLAALKVLTFCLVDPRVVRFV